MKSKHDDVNQSRERTGGAQRLILDIVILVSLAVAVAALKAGLIAVATIFFLLGLAIILTRYLQWRYRSGRSSASS